MHKQIVFLAKFLLVMVLLLSVSACSVNDVFTLQGTATPVIHSTMLSSDHERTVPVGQKLYITSAHEDSAGIREVTFFVNDAQVDVHAPEFPQNFYQTTFEWTPPAVGSYPAKIVAYNNKGAIVLPELTFYINAGQGVIEQVATQAEVATPTPFATAGCNNCAACLNQSLFVADITIPDGSTLQPGAAFNKTWRIKNTGTCNWVTGYTFNPVSGPALGAGSINIPVTNAGNTVDLTVAMVAPTQPGTYRSNWRLSDNYGKPFGSIFYVDFNVPSSQTCSQPPVIQSFTATPSNIAPGQSSTLSWIVTGATSVSVTPLPQLQTAASGLTVSPDKTTVYTLEARNGNCVSVAYVTVTVTGNACQGLVINRFDAVPATIHRGESSVLTWDVTGATNVTITPSPQMMAQANTMQVSPDTTTVYTLQAGNAVCNLSRQTTVTVAGETVLLDFIAEAAAATWQADLGTLPWGGSPADSAGYVRWLSNPILQNGSSAMHVLEAKPNGASLIQGHYPVNIVGGLLPSDQIVLKLGYLQGATTSSGAGYMVKFISPGGSANTISSLTLDPDGSLTTITLPLSGVQAGQQGEFIIEVDRGTNPAGNVAVWVDARLIRP